MIPIHTFPFPISGEGRVCSPGEGVLIADARDNLSRRFHVNLSPRGEEPRNTQHRGPVRIETMYRLTLAIVALFATCPVVSAQEKSTPDKPKINFTDHVLPVFRQHCLKCHNANEAKGGLAIDSYAALMEGGGSGEIVYDGDADGSRLYQLMTHEDTPEMPPNQDPLPKEQLDIIKQWINGGLLESSGSKARKKKGPSLSLHGDGCQREAGRNRDAGIALARSRRRILSSRCIDRDRRQPVGSVGCDRRTETGLTL